VAPSFEGWRESRPPVVATLIKTSSGTTMVLLADHALPNTDATWDASYNGKTASLAITRRANGDGVAEWSVPRELGWDSPTSTHTFSSAYNQNPFMPNDIHAVFPNGGHQYVTGVGMGWTWVANAPAAPFKIMYTCFDKRNQAAEASAPDGGVASGGGWHRIGDNAETVLNDLEGAPIALGSALADPANGTTPSGGLAYG